MLTAKHYQVNRDAFNHDGEDFTHGDVIAMHEGRAEQHVAVGALVETDAELTVKAPPAAPGKVEGGEGNAPAPAPAPAAKKAAPAKSSKKK